MKIAQFIDTDGPGGAERVVIDLSRQLIADGHEVVVLHFGNRFLERECERHAIESKIVPGYRSYKKTSTLPVFALILQRFLRRERIDVLHSHLMGPVTGGALAARLAGVRHVGTLHDVYTLAEKPSRIKLLQLAMLCGTRLVTVSRQMERYYREQGGFSNGHLRTIYNGVEPLVRNDERAVVRRQLGLADDTVAVISVGRLVELKRHDLLLIALERLEDLPVKLIIAGDGPCRDALERQSAALGLQDRVILLGEREDVPALLAASDIFALASRTEGLSCSVLEAMTAGLPVVATDVGGNAELICEGESGFLIPTGDAESLQERLRGLIEDPGLRAQLGAKGRERAQTLFSPPHALQEYMALYQEKAA